MSIVDIYRQNLSRGTALWGSLAGVPEMGVSERISGQQLSPSQQQMASWPQANLQSQPLPSSQYLPSNQYTGGAGVTRGGSTGGLGASNQGYFLQQPSGPSYDDIEAAFNPVLASIEARKQQYQAGWPAYEQQITSEYQALKPQIEAEKTEQMLALETGKTEAQGQAKGQIAKTRQSYNELRQQELARLSAMGLSSSSVAEGSMEMLGREAMGQLGNVRTTLAQTLSGIAAESRRVETWFADKITETELASKNAIAQARIKFQETLDQIDTLRTQTEMAKGQRRLDARDQYLQAVNNIQEFNANMAFALDQWRTKKQQTLDQAAQEKATWEKYGYTLEELRPILGDFSSMGYQPKNITLSQSGRFVPTFEPIGVGQETLTDEERAKLEAQGFSVGG